MLEVANLILIVMATECLNKDYAEAFHMHSTYTTSWPIWKDWMLS